MATIAQVHIKTEQGTYIYSYLGKDFVHVMNNLEREARGNSSVCLYGFLYKYLIYHYYA